MDPLVEFLVEDDDSDTSENSIRIRNRHMRDATNIYDLPELEFGGNFRMSKECFGQILSEIGPKMKSTCLATAISPELKFAAFLRFLASGSYQKCVANSCLSLMSQATMSRVVSECLDIFEEHFCGKWISVEMTSEEETVAKRDFYTKYHFPGVIGCVDCTHIKICSPKQDLKHLYYNRKGYYSINAMMIFDQNMVIRYVDATHPGANHDAYVWRISAANDYFATAYNTGRGNTWILGDSGYQLLPYLMTPYRSPTEHHQVVFNEKHCKARNVIERCFGVLKNRFRCLLQERGLHYSPQKCTKIINACCALHNTCIFYKNAWPHIETENVNGIDESYATVPPSELSIGIRDRIARNML